MTGCARVGGRDKKYYSDYECTNRKPYCMNRGISKTVLERYVVELLEKEIFNDAAVKRIMERINQRRKEQGKHSKTEAQQQEMALAAIDEELRNLTDAVAKGLLSEALVQRITTLEEERRQVMEKKCQ